ncbi:benzoate/H(+) symporter BenE family transporter [Nocardioides sp. ChNu-153]|uniref:benzoate/H(+) symporter BenE family transporter n=1 Tax=unclassified Nocardioides TaxID=2615069 RepID=UPI002406229A|nr:MULTISPECIES: benzoate/H(+) symporter BenE family transporter [unclassified Nocardioides]MDN7119952.1 benzoate/H(+) symporter BenE family transporter [Nocardioides sp. ChNu-153]
MRRTPTHAAEPRGSLVAPVLAGVVTALVGFTSSFAVVLAGLRAAGGSPEDAASGLLALTVAFGLGIVGLALWHRVPVTLAWSTPGAALLVSTGTVDGGWPAAVGAFALVGVLVVLTGLVPWLGRLVERIPPAVAQAMLAGVLLPLVLAPVETVGASPALALPVVATWLVVTRLAPRWAVPAALVACLVVIAVELSRSGTTVDGPLLPVLTWTTPTLTPAAVVGIALPLYVVTMASQNVPGAAVLRSFGYGVPWRSSMAATGAGTVVAAPFGGHAINLAALSAALAAGEEAGPDRDRRWVAALSAGVAYLLLALVSGALTTLTAAAPSGLVETVAGLALLGAFGAAAATAMADPASRTSAVVTFLVAAGGVSVAGIGGAFWALVAGLAVRAVLERPRGVGETA